MHPTALGSRCTALFLSALVLVAAPAQAFFVNGTSLASEMQEWRNAVEDKPGADFTLAVSYLSYVKGVFDAYELNKLVCPGPASASQVAGGVADFLQENRERWSEPAFYLVADALKTAFPCEE